MGEGRAGALHGQVEGRGQSWGGGRGTCEVNSCRAVLPSPTLALGGPVLPLFIHSAGGH